MPRQTYYELLEVAASADVETIKQAYRHQIRRYHPDRLAGQRARLQRSGDAFALRKLERKIDAAQETTQRINEAYAVLTDPAKRAVYDRRLSEQRMTAYREEVRAQRTRHPEYQRRTVKSRPHRRGPLRGANPDAVPWPLLVALLLLVVCGFSWLTGMFVNRPGAIRTHTPRRATAVGVITAYDLQATENARQATYSVRTQVASLPSATPRSAAANERSADALYELGNYPYAIELYGQALASNSESSRLYTKRGLAYTGLFVEGDAAAADLGLADFDRALQLDSGWAAAYRGRGLLHYARWKVSRSSNLAERALADLENYGALVNSPGDEVTTALSVLRLAETR